MAEIIALPGAAAFSIQQKRDRRLPPNVTELKPSLPARVMARIEELRSVIYICERLRDERDKGEYPATEWNRICAPRYEPAKRELSRLKHGIIS